MHMIFVDKYCFVSHADDIDIMDLDLKVLYNYDHEWLSRDLELLDLLCNSFVILDKVV